MFFLPVFKLLLICFKFILGGANWLEYILRKLIRKKVDEFYQMKQARCQKEKSRFLTRNTQMM